MTKLPLVPEGRLGAQKLPQESPCGSRKGRKPRRWFRFLFPWRSHTSLCHFFIFSFKDGCQEILFYVRSLYEACAGE